MLSVPVASNAATPRSPPPWPHRIERWHEEPRSARPRPADELSDSEACLRNASIALRSPTVLRRPQERMRRVENATMRLRALGSRSSRARRQPVPRGPQPRVGLFRIRKASMSDAGRSTARWPTLSGQPHRGRHRPPPPHVRLLSTPRGLFREAGEIVTRADCRTVRGVVPRAPPARRRCARDSERVSASICSYMTCRRIDE